MSELSAHLAAVHQHVANANAIIAQTWQRLEWLGLEPPRRRDHLRLVPPLPPEDDEPED